MTNTNGSEDWRVLCELARKEKDPEKLIDLITKIDQALEDQRTGYPVSGNAYSHLVSPPLSPLAKYDC